MNLKKYIKFLMETNPNVKPHGTPVNRRDLLAQGYIASNSLFLVPSVLSSLSSIAKADNCKSNEPNLDIPFFIVIDCAGGFNGPGRNIFVGGEGGRDLPAEAYTSLGIANNVEDYRTQVQEKENLIGIPMNPLGTFARIIKENTSELTRKNSDGALICARSNDDTSNNELNPVGYIAQAIHGSLISGVSTSNTFSGGNSRVPSGSLAPENKPAFISGSQAARELVLPGVLSDLLGSKVSTILKQGELMNRRQLANFSQKSVSDQVKEILECAGKKGIDQLTNFKMSEIDPSQDDIITNIFGADSDLGSMAKLVLDGYAGFGVRQIGGCDYHGQNQNQIISKDTQIATEISNILEAANQKKRDGMICVITDGGIACSSNNRENPDGDQSIRPGFLPSSDSSTRSCIQLYTVNGSGSAKPEYIQRQIGHFSQNGSIDRLSWEGADSPVLAAKLIAHHYLAFAKKSDKEIKDIIEKEIADKDKAFLVNNS